MLSDFKAPYKLHNSKQYDAGTKTYTQISGTKQSAEVSPWTYSHFNRDKNMQQEKECLFNKWYQGNWTTTHKKNKT